MCVMALYVCTDVTVYDWQTPVIISICVYEIICSLLMYCI